MLQKASANLEKSPRLCVLSFVFVT